MHLEARWVHAQEQILEMIFLREKKEKYKKNHPLVYTSIVTNKINILQYEYDYNHIFND